MKRVLGFCVLGICKFVFKVFTLRFIFRPKLRCTLSKHGSKMMSIGLKQVANLLVCSVLLMFTSTSKSAASESAPAKTETEIVETEIVETKKAGAEKAETKKAGIQVQSSSVNSQPDDTLDLNSKPKIKLGLTQSSFDLGASESMIAWERWHHAVGRAIHKRVQKATTTCLGEVVLDIRITKDCKLTAAVLSTTNPKIADASLTATQSLDGDTIMIFPVDSKRQTVHFKFEYRRGFFFFPKNHYITDDYEKLPEDKESGANENIEH